jgi:hypothetical protein
VRGFRLFEMSKLWAMQREKILGDKKDLQIDDSMAFYFNNL